MEEFFLLPPFTKSAGGAAYPLHLGSSTTAISLKSDIMPLRSSRTSSSRLKVRVIVPPSTTAASRQGQQWRETLEKYRSNSSIYRRMMVRGGSSFQIPDRDNVDDDYHNNQEEDVKTYYYSRDPSFLSRDTSAAGFSRETFALYDEEEDEESAWVHHHHPNQACDGASSWLFQYVKPEWLDSMEYDENEEEGKDAHDEERGMATRVEEAPRRDERLRTTEPPPSHYEPPQPSCRALPDWLQSMLFSPQNDDDNDEDEEEYDDESETTAPTNIFHEAARTFLFYDEDESVPTLDQSQDDSVEGTASEEKHDDHPGVESAYLLWQEEQQSWALARDAVQLERAGSMRRETSGATSTGRSSVTYDSLVALVPNYEARV